MLKDIPAPVEARMRALEKMSARQKAEGMEHFVRLRQVPLETGRFLAIMAATAPPGRYIEIGTSGGYSGLWISLACRALGRRLTTFELADAKVDLATETFREAGVDDIVEIVRGDARDHLASQRDVSFCFLDTEKDLYEDCYDLFAPNMVSGAVLVADNVLSHEEAVEGFMKTVEEDGRFDSMTVPVGSGLLLARKV